MICRNFYGGVGWDIEGLKGHAFHELSFTIFNCSSRLFLIFKEANFQTPPLLHACKTLQSDNPPIKSINPTKRTPNEIVLKSKIDRINIHFIIWVYKINIEHS
jgi:hypothetical protein